MLITKIFTNYELKIKQVEIYRENIGSAVGTHQFIVSLPLACISKYNCTDKIYGAAFSQVF